MKKKKSPLAEFVQGYIVAWIGKIMYLTGLTMLIPFFPLLFSPDQLLLKVLRTGTFFVGAILVIGSTLIIFKFYKQTRTALQVLATFTLIPAFIAGVYALAGAELFDKVVSWAGPAQPYVHQWLAFNLPKAVTIAVVYLLIGIAFLISSFVWPKQALSKRRR